MAKLVKTEGGFSLIEVMLVLVILLLITGAVFNSLVNVQKSFDAEMANTESQENCRYAVNRIADIIRTAGNNPQNVTALNGMSFIRLYDSFDPATGTGSPAGGKPIPASGTVSGKAIQLFSDFDSDGRTVSDVSVSPVATTIFATNLITSENIVIYRDAASVANANRSDLVMAYSFNSPSGTPRSAPVAEFVTDLEFTIDSAQNQVLVSVTTRSNRAVSIESIFERRFRYSNIISLVRLRNR